MFRRTALILSALILGIIGCSQQTAPVDIEAEKTAVAAVLANYVDAVEKEDMNLYSAVISHDSTMINFGSTGDPIIGWEALKKVIESQNSALDSIDVEVSDVRIHVAPCGGMAWATSLWTLKAKAVDKSVSLQVRCTWALEKDGNIWLIVHFHKSVAAV